jgi:hypothetical protein
MAQGEISAKKEVSKGAAIKLLLRIGMPACFVRCSYLVQDSHGAFTGY